MLKTQQHVHICKVGREVKLSTSCCRRHSGVLQTSNAAAIFYLPMEDLLVYLLTAAFATIVVVRYLRSYLQEEP